MREPWPSKTTGANIVHGVITRDEPLRVTWQMAENGVVFSDGIEADYLAFTAGLAVAVGLAQKKSQLGHAGVNSIALQATAGVVTHGGSLLSSL